MILETLQLSGTEDCHQTFAGGDTMTEMMMMMVMMKMMANNDDDTKA